MSGAAHNFRSASSVTDVVPSWSVHASAMLLLPTIRNWKVPSELSSTCSSNTTALVKPSHGSKVKVVDTDSLLISEVYNFTFRKVNKTNFLIPVHSYYYYYYPFTFYLIKLSIVHNNVTSNNAMARIRKEVVVTQDEILSQHLFGGTE